MSLPKISFGDPQVELEYQQIYVQMRTRTNQKAKLRGRTLSSRGVDTVALHAGLNTSGLSRKVEVEAKFKLARGHDLIVAVQLQLQL